jgi:hypothetical protein
MLHRMHFTVEFDETETRKCPVREFLDQLKVSDPDDFAVVVAGLSKLRNRQYHREPLSQAIATDSLNSAMLANSISAYLVLPEESLDCCVARRFFGPESAPVGKTDAAREPLFPAWIRLAHRMRA